MVNNVIRFIVDVNGNLLEQPQGRFRANNNTVDTVQFVAPFDIADIVSMTFTKPSFPDLTQYNVITTYKGMDVVEETNPLYQDVADYNVWEVNVKDTILAFISKYRNTDITMSFQIGSIEPNAKCLDFKGYFGVDSPLPTEDQTEGDYYACEDIEFAMADNGNGRSYTFGKGMYVYWNGSYWVKVRLVAKQNVNATDIPVEANAGQGYELDEDDVNYLEGVGSTVNTFDARITQNTNDIEDLETAMNGDLDLKVDKAQTIVGIDLQDNITQNELKAALDIDDLENNKADKTYVDNQNTAQDVVINQKADKIYVDTQDAAQDVKINNLEIANMFKNVSYNTTTGIMTFTKYDDTTLQIDLPLELIIESGYYNEDDNKLVLVLANGDEIDIPVGDLLTDLDAVNIRYSNGDSSLLAVNVKTAIDELDDKIVNLDSGDIAVGTAESPSGVATTQLGVNLDMNAKKADKEQPSWIEPTLVNSWTGNVKYRKNTIGQVEVTGNLTVGIGTINTQIFTLPSTYFNTANNTPIIAFNASDGGSVILRVNVGGSVVTGETITTGKIISVATVLPIGDE